MTWDIIFRKAARKEFDEAYDFYESRKEGLGEEFAQCVQVELKSLEINPKVHAKIYKEARRAVVKRFPYCIYYIIRSEQVHIVSVFHTSRNPRKWQSRI
jgi:plasmid stabilization system protein ParE